MNNPQSSLPAHSSQVKSKQRVTDHGEVFTAEREVKAMLDLVQTETERLDSRFLEPACGDGNFLIEILSRKMQVVSRLSGNSLSAYQLNTCRAVASIYGVELMADNTEACRQRLYNYVAEQYCHTFPDIHSSFDTDTQDNAFLRTIRFLLERNIICGDALTYCCSDGTPIVFSEWTFIGEQVSRCDFRFNFLVEKKHQYSLFDEQGEPQQFDRPIQAFSPVHYTQLYSLHSNHSNDTR